MELFVINDNNPSLISIFITNFSLIFYILKQVRNILNTFTHSLKLSFISNN